LSFNIILYATIQHVMIRAYKSSVECCGTRNIEDPFLLHFVTSIFHRVIVLWISSARSPLMNKHGVYACVGVSRIRKPREHVAWWIKCYVTITIPRYYDQLISWLVVKFFVATRRSCDCLSSDSALNRNHSRCHCWESI